MPKSLAAITFRRSVTTGRSYLLIGTVFSGVVALVVTQLPSGGQVVFPLELPMFATMGSMGGLMVFTSDRAKGVFEYLLAYGLTPPALFTNGLVAAAGLATIVLGTSLGVGLASIAGSGAGLPWPLVEALILYSVPMSYATSVFAAMCGMIWSSLSTPRTGLNSPVGVAPLLGVGPSILILFVATAVPRSQFFYVADGGVALVFLIVAALVLLSPRLTTAERFLSPI